MKRVKFGLMGVALAAIFAIVENGLSQIALAVPVGTGCEDSGACKDSGMAAGCSLSENSKHSVCGCATNPDGSITGGNLYYCKGNR